MSTEQMKRHVPQVITAAVIAICLLAGYGAMELANADGVELAVQDAGVHAPAPDAAAPALADPVADSSGFARDVQSAFKAGRWALLVVLFLFGVSRALLAVAAKWNVAWLKRATPALVAGSAALAAVGASLSAGGAVDWHAAAGGLAMVVALYLAPAPKVQ
jgi:hypothetical protein